MLLRWCQTPEDLADAKAENDALRDDVAAGHRQFYIKAVCQSVREATTASGAWTNTASPTGGACWTDYFTLREEADHYAKQLEGQNYIVTVQIELPISMGNSCAIIVSNTHALPAEV